MGLFSILRYSNPFSTSTFLMHVILLLLRVNLRNFYKVYSPSTHSISLLARFNSVNSVRFSNFSILEMRLPAKFSSLMLLVCTSTICLIVLLLRLRVSRCCRFYKATISIKKLLEISTIYSNFRSKMHSILLMPFSLRLSTRNL